MQLSRTRPLFRTIAVAALLVAVAFGVANTRADIKWEASLPKKNDISYSESSCKNYTDAGKEPDCDTGLQPARPTTHPPINGTMPQCMSLLERWKWGRCEGDKLEEGMPMCEGKYLKCATYEFYSQIGKTGQGNYVCNFAILDSSGKIATDNLYVSNACTP